MPSARELFITLVLELPECAFLANLDGTHTPENNQSKLPVPHFPGTDLSGLSSYMHITQGCQETNPSFAKTQTPTPAHTLQAGSKVTFCAIFKATRGGGGSAQ